MRPGGTLLTMALAQLLWTGCYRSDVIRRSELWRLDGMHPGSPRFIAGGDDKPIKIDTHTRFTVVSHGRALPASRFDWIDVANGRFTAVGAIRVELGVGEIDRIEVETHDAAESNIIVGTLYGLFVVAATVVYVLLTAFAAGAHY